jgi:hypothetical protein
MNMKKRNPLIIGLGLAILLPLLALAWWFWSPLFLNQVVDEAFPGMPEMAQTEMAEDSMDQDNMGQDSMAMDDEMMDDNEAMMDDEDMMGDANDMDDADEMDNMAEMDDGDGMMSDEADDMAMDEEAASEAEPLLVKEGMFRNGGPSYSGSGRAAIYRLADGSHVLRLEDFSVTNGPDLRVLLAAHPDPQTSNALHSQAVIELEPLKGNQGNQNYLIPAGVDIAGQGSVVIYCQPFSVIFSVAPLAAGG